MPDLVLKIHHKTGGQHPAAPSLEARDVNRREFARTLAGAALSAAALPGGAAAAETEAQSSAKGIPFKLSVMLWTVYRDLPFEQRLEKVAEAGYQAVELVDEFKDWKKQDFADARRKKRELGIE